MSPEQEQRQRARFEAWQATRVKRADLARDSTGRYYNFAVLDDWIAWCACVEFRRGVSNER